MRCGECGYDYEALERGELPGAVRDRSRDFVAVFGGLDPEAVRVKPSETVWSPLEYACHMRDVLRVQRERVWLALVEPTPEWSVMRRDERAVDEQYNEQDPVVVAGELEAAADSLAEMFESLDDGGWARTGIYPVPEPTEHTTEWVGRHTIHELVHHMADVSGRPGS